MEQEASELHESVKAEEDLQSCIDAIREGFGEWERADLRSNDACYAVLAEIFVRSAALAADSVQMGALHRMARNHPDVARSKRYDPRGATAASLLLTIMFGLKKRRNVKSNWATVLKAAEKLNGAGKLERTKEAFVKWIGIEGVEGARNVLRGEKQQFKYAVIDELEDSTATIELPFRR